MPPRHRRFGFYMIRENKSRAVFRIAAVFLSLTAVLQCGIGSVRADDIYRVKMSEGAPLELIPGGMPFGVQLTAEGVTVVGVGDVKSGGTLVRPAADAGIAERDVITEVNGTKVNGVAELADAVNSSGESPVKLTVKRGERELFVTVTPVKSDDDGRYRTGMLIKEGMAGIGTVTYIHPSTGSFAGLGHGICDADSGKIVPTERGRVVNVAISGVIKGKPGSPGELQGYFSSGKIGTLFDNRDCGVYGVFCAVPQGALYGAVPVALAKEVCEGEAELLCTTGGDGVGRYKVWLSNVDKSGRGIKNFVVTVTDPALLECTGGIVQGMSGSPIIQNGKLVGAVTHVLVNDPSRGYGIFIKNMLEAG